jgi:hypothetical protein
MVIWLEEHVIVITREMIGSATHGGLERSLSLLNLWWLSEVVVVVVRVA